MIVSAKARVSGVLGWPIGHSLSPPLHGYWLERYRIDGAYLPLPVRPEKLGVALNGLVAAGFAGANVTIPHKEAALAAADEADPLAKRIGAANTLIFREGKILAINSDAFGFMENLRAAAPDWRAAAGPATVLGAGGAARAIIVALQDAGVPEIRVINRTTERADALAEDLGAGLVVRPWEARAVALAEATLLVNTTSLGLAGQPALDLDLAQLPETAIVTDVVYRPLVTPLLIAAAARGHRVVDGLGMLLHQARPGFAAWFGREPEVTDALRAFLLGEHE